MNDSQFCPQGIYHRIRLGVREAKIKSAEHEVLGRYKVRSSLLENEVGWRSFQKEGLS